MEPTFEQWQMARMLQALTDSMGARSKAAHDFREWLDGNESLVGLDPRAKTKGAAKKDRDGKKLSAGEKKEAAWRQLRERLAAIASHAEPAPDTREENLRAFAEAFGLTAQERALLRLLLFYGKGWRFENLLDDMVYNRHFTSDALIAVLLGWNLPATREILKDGELARAGLLSHDNYSDYFCYATLPVLVTALSPPRDGLAEVERFLLGDPRGSDLRWSDFAHLAEARDFARDILKGAATERAVGVNILLYGPPGSGKTELAKLLASEAGCQLYLPADADSHGVELNRFGRLAELRLRQKLAARRPGAVLLFDEMEDLAGYGSVSHTGNRSFRRASSKVYMNRLLEQNPVPILWISNDLDCFDPAFLRRMTFALELRRPPAAIRRQSLKRAVERAGLELPAGQIELLAEELPVTPAIYDTAVRATALAGGQAQSLEPATRALAKAVNWGRTPPLTAQRPGHYDPALVAADRDLLALEQGFLAPDAPSDFSLCLHGPPGSGKSAWLRHLAARLGLEVSIKRTSDLLSCWVGESEKNIAEAFAEAREAELFLIFDEADSLLADRRGARQSWEVSKVNEMLTWMECHPLPFGCSTNLLEALDPAAFRRFTFKIRFGFLDGKRAAAAWRLFFKSAPPAALPAIDGLTPADFALVARQLRYRATPAGPAEILRLLEKECSLKEGCPKPIGFRV